MEEATKYEKKLRKKYPTIYNDIKGKVDQVPDQRLFEDKIIKSELKEWTPYLIWKSLYYELDILDNADERGDYNDDTIFRIIERSINRGGINPVEADNYHIDSVEITNNIISGQITTNIKDTLKYGLTNFFATYPILSYLFIHLTENYPLAIIGRHPIIIKEISADNWKEKNGIFTLPAAKLIVYSTNKHDINLLLNAININKEYDYICHTAVNSENRILFIELWKQLNNSQKADKTFTTGIALFDLLNFIVELENIDKSLINTDLWKEVIRFGAIKILKYLLANYKIINLKTIYSSLSKFEDPRTNFHLTLKLLSENYDLPRFYEKYDLLRTIIEMNDLDAIKLAVELRINIRDGVIVNNKPLSPLLIALNMPSPNHIADYMLTLYNVNEDDLLCAAVKNDMEVAVSYLLENFNYSNVNLEEALSYVSNMAIMRELLSWLNVRTRNIPDVFEVNDDI